MTFGRKLRILRERKATTEHHKTRDILHVMKVLGHKNIKNTLIYIDLEKAIYGSPEDDEFIVKVAHNLKEACEFVEAGFEYVTEMEGAKIFKKRK